MVKGKLDCLMQKKKIRTSLSPYTKLNSKWNEDLKLKLEMMKLVKIIKKISKTTIKSQYPSK